MPVLHKVLMSKAARSVSYDTDRKILEVKFHNGHEYDYPNVPNSTYQSLIAADSFGRAFQKLILAEPRKHPPRRTNK